MSVVNIAFGASGGDHKATAGLPLQMSRASSLKSLGRPVSAFPSSIRLSSSSTHSMTGGEPITASRLSPLRLAVKQTAGATTATSTPTTLTSTLTRQSSQQRPMTGSVFKRGASAAATIGQALQSSSSPTLPKHAKGGISTTTATITPRKQPSQPLFISNAVLKTLTAPAKNISTFSGGEGAEKSANNGLFSSESTDLIESDIRKSSDDTAIRSSEDDGFIQEDQDDDDGVEVIIANAVAAAHAEPSAQSPRFPQTRKVSNNHSIGMKLQPKPVRKMYGRPVSAFPSIVTPREMTLDTAQDETGPWGGLHELTSRQDSSSSSAQLHTSQHDYDHAGSTALLNMASVAGVKEAAAVVSRERPGSAHPTVVLAVNALDNGAEPSKVLTSILRQRSTEALDGYKNTGVGFSRMLASLASSKRLQADSDIGPNGGSRPQSAQVLGSSVAWGEKKAEVREQAATHMKPAERPKSVGPMHERQILRAVSAPMLELPSDTYELVREATFDIMEALRPSIRPAEVNVSPSLKPASSPNMFRAVHRGNSRSARKRKQTAGVFGADTIKAILAPVVDGMQQGRGRQVKSKDYGADSRVGPASVLQGHPLLQAQELSPEKKSRPLSASGRLESPLRQRVPLKLQPQLAPDYVLKNSTHHTVVANLLDTGIPPQLMQDNHAPIDVKPYKGLLLRQDSPSVGRLHVSLSTLRPVSAMSSARTTIPSLHKSRGISGLTDPTIAVAIRKVDLQPAHPTQSPEARFAERPATATPQRVHRDALLLQSAFLANSEYTAIGSPAQQAILQMHTPLQPMTGLQVNDVSPPSGSGRGMHLVTDQAEDFNAWGTSDERTLLPDLHSPPTTFLEDDIRPPSPRFSGSLARLMASVGSAKKDASKRPKSAIHRK